MSAVFGLNLFAVFEWPGCALDSIIIFLSALFFFSRKGREVSHHRSLTFAVWGQEKELLLALIPIDTEAWVQRVKPSRLTFPHISTALPCWSCKSTPFFVAFCTICSLKRDVHKRRKPFRVSPLSELLARLPQPGVCGACGYEERRGEETKREEKKGTYSCVFESTDSLSCVINVWAGFEPILQTFKEHLVLCNIAVLLLLRFFLFFHSCKSF